MEQEEGGFQKMRVHLYMHMHILADHVTDKGSQEKALRIESPPSEKRPSNLSRLPSLGCST